MKATSGTWYIETTTMYQPGEDSIAELTFAEAEALREGRKKVGRHRLLYDHRWGEVKNLSDRVALRRALMEAYGDAIGWMDVDSLIDEFYDLRNTAEDSRRYFLNTKTSSSEAWLREHEWVACKRPDRALKKGDLVTLGLDGAVRDDSTALVACRVADGHIELIGLWECPAGPEGEGWQVDREAVDAAVAHAMRWFNVAGFYLDPPYWADYADVWHHEFAEKMQVKATVRRPLEWWTNRPTAVVAALQRFHEAVLEERLSYTPAEDRAGREAELALALQRHALNARRAPSRAGLQIRKEFPKSPKKIDGVMAAVLAWEARGDAVAAGVKAPDPEAFMPRRVR